MEDQSSESKKKYYNNMIIPINVAKYYFSIINDIVNKPQKILDLGCGLGDFGKFNPNPSIDIYGVDIDTDAVAIAKNYEIAQVIDIEKGTFPFEGSYFDVVIAKDILEHMQKPWIVVREVNRVLRSGGIVIANVPNTNPNTVWDDYSHVRGFTENALRLLFEDTGFIILSINRMGSIPLAGEYDLIRYIPYVLKIPPLNYFFGQSLQIVAQKR